MSDDVLQITEKKRSKCKGERKKIYPTDRRVQKNSKRDKKAFLNEQYTETEENNRMGKTRDLFKKIRDAKGRFQAKMGTIKDRKHKDLTEAEQIKKTWQKIYRTAPKRS